MAVYKPITNYTSVFWKTNDKKFEELFREHINLSVEASDELSALFSNFSNKDEHVRTIDDLESKADGVVAHVHELLDESFITRLDKTDIIALIDELDHIIDYMKSAATRMDVYGVANPPQAAGEFGTLIQTMVHELAGCFGNVATMPLIKAKEHMKKLKKLEGDADRLLDRTLGDIFKNNDDWKETLAWKDVFERLADITDHCQHVATILTSIARKEAN